MYSLKLRCFIFLCFFANTLIAQNTAKVQTRPNGGTSGRDFLNPKDWSFVENKGQLADEKGNLLPDIKYYGHPETGRQGGVYLYCKPGMISFVFTKVEKEPDQISEATGKMIASPPNSKFESDHSTHRSTFSRADLVLLGSNANAQISATDQQEYYENFYNTADPEGEATLADHGITDVHSYKTITYRNIYPNIDMVIHCRARAMKYEFVVYPGGKLSDIRMQWNGLEKNITKDQENLVYMLAAGTIKESNPISFQSDKIIESEFAVKNNIVSFEVPKYNEKQILVIDPLLTWSTYIFGANNESVETIATEGSGFVYISGYTQAAGIATTGAYQTNFSNGQSAYLAKFDYAGNRYWSTYYNGYDTYGIASEGSGVVYIAGGTDATTGVPTYNGYQTSYGGNGDAFLAKFDINGYKKWATYFGGSAADFATAVVVDGYSNVFISGLTFSSSGIASSGAYQTANNGNGDGFLAKFSNNGTLAWSTYFGGSGEEDCTGLAADNSGNVFITGNTGSSSSISTSGAWQTSIGGGAFDAYLAKFNTNGNLKWSTYFGGSGNDHGKGVCTDKSGNVIMTGLTASTSGIASSGAWQSTMGSLNYADAFLAQFSSTGARLWSTYYGGPGTNSGKSVCTDSKGSIYLTGFTNSETGIATGGTYQTLYGGGADDAFLVKFNNYGTRIWGSYFGGSSWDIGNIVVADTRDNIYLAGCTQSTGNMATSGAFDTYATGGMTGFVSKFIMMGNDAKIESIVSPAGKSCSGLDSIIVTLRNFGRNNLDSILIGVRINKKYQPTWKWKGHLLPDSSIRIAVGAFNFPAGIDTLTCWTMKPNNAFDSVVRNDTTVIIDTFLTSPEAKTGSPANLCYGNTDTLGAAALSGHSYAWSSNPAGFSASKSNIVVKPLMTTTYYLTETIAASGCSKTDSVTVFVYPIPTAKIIANQNSCTGDSIHLGGLPDSGTSLYYNWTSSPAGYLYAFVSDPVVRPTFTITYFLNVSNAYGCAKYDSVTITVNPKPTADFSFATVCPGDSTPFLNTSNSATSYAWTFGDGNTSAFKSPKHLYAGKGSYSVSLKATNTYGCSDSTSQKLILSPCVWPGDANNDKTVDMSDFLSIGIGYGTVGHPRSFANSSWSAQVSPDWDSSFASGVNYKHADCNGDSIIDDNDTLAIMGNYGKSHPKSSALVQGSPADPSFSIHYKQNTFFAGDTLKAIISLGNVKNPVNNLYGLKFSIVANPLLFQADKAFLSFNSSFLGTPKTELLGLRINDIANSATDIGLTRITHTNISGYGDIATLYIPINPKLPGEYNMTSLNITNNVQISINEKTVPLYFTSDSVLIKQDKTGTMNLGNNNISEVDIYPNPFSTSTTLQYHLDKSSQINISICDITGKQIALITNEKQMPGDYKTDINAGKYHLQPGVYLLKFEVDGECLSRNIVKM